MPSALIVGGGVFGLGAAISLRKRGYDVTLIDQNELIADFSSSNDINRIARMDYGSDAFYAGFAQHAISRWRALNDQASREGTTPLYHECGIVLATTRDMTSGYEYDSYNMMKTMQARITRVSHKAGSPIWSKIAGWSSESGQNDGYINHDAGWVDAGATVKEFARLAKSLGVVFQTGKAGTFTSTIDDLNGKVKGVKVASGAAYFADITIIAAGAWSPSYVPQLQNLLQAVAQPVVYLQVPPHVQPIFNDDQFPVWLSDVARTGYYGFPCTQSGIFKAGNHGDGFINPVALPDGRTCSVPIRGVPPQETIDTIMQFLHTTFPKLTEAKLVSSKLCWYCDSWDSYFYIDHVPKRQGLMVACGGSGHGFKFAPVIGDVIADVVMGIPNQFAQKFGWREPEQRESQTEACRMRTTGPKTLNIAKL